MNRSKGSRIYEVLLVGFSLILITVIAHLTLPIQQHPQVFYPLVLVWVLLLSVLILALYRKDIEIDTRLHIVRFAYLSATLVQESRKISATILKSHKQAEIDKQKALGFRAVLNLAHEYYSFIKNEHCTANIALIGESSRGEKVCRIIQYDDFVANARQELEVEIPLDTSLFGEIIKRELRAITIDNYTLDRYPIYITPIIEEGYCLSGICVPIWAFNRIVGFFNIDSMKINIFKPAEDERIATFFGELLGRLIQDVECTLHKIHDKERLQIKH